MDSHASEQAPASGQLWERIQEAYKSAVECGAASSISNTPGVLHDSESGVQFVIRVADALKSKPTVVTKSKSGSPVNPFLPYDEQLWVGHLSARHTLLLNKFNLVAHHVLIVTREFEPQDDDPNGADLFVTMKVLQAFPHGGIAYYNHGPLSGKSQPHKHVQAVPLPLGEPPAAPVPLEGLITAALDGVPAGEASGSVPVRQLPFKAFACRLEPSASDQDLESNFQQLLHAAGLQTSGEAPEPPESYNFLMTCGWMLLVPRGAEACGPVATNSMGYAGTFFLRSQDEIDFVKSHGPVHCLSQMACAW